MKQIFVKGAPSAGAVKTRRTPTPGYERYVCESDYRKAIQSNIGKALLPVVQDPEVKRRKPRRKKELGLGPGK